MNAALGLFFIFRFVEMRGLRGILQKQHSCFRTLPHVIISGPYFAAPIMLPALRNCVFLVFRSAIAGIGKKPIELHATAPRPGKKPRDCTRPRRADGGSTNVSLRNGRRSMELRLSHGPYSDPVQFWAGGPRHIDSWGAHSLIHSQCV